MTDAPRISLPSRSRPPAAAFVAVLAGNVALAFGPWFVRMADVGPVASAFWRLTLAAPLLAIAMVAMKQTPRKLPGVLWLTLLLSGLFFAGDLASWHLGILKTKLANATLFGNATSLMFPIYGFLLARAWPNRWQVAALLLAAVGAGLMFGQSYELSPENLVGDLLCALAGLLYTLYFIAMMRARDTMPPLPALTLSTLAGILPLAIAVPLFGETFLPQDWGPLIALALASQVLGQGLMIYALGHLEPIVVGIALLSQPLVAGAIGWLAYGETLGPIDFAGAAMVAAALVLVRRGPRAPAQLAPPGAASRLGE
ncbi:DMT family transporter [Sphingomonas gilva]|uniref:DMT family transporter n=1 Tax=Sphingomonas gilva TaxID=2305907 RepID=A0A396RN07_9SPHN|nr:DMT family transporter [Sphingomonas gilva]RHW17768.1 DMT family transporter [Sphingomonas gilva]